MNYPDPTIPYDPATMMAVPVAVPLPVTIDDGDMVARRKLYDLPRTLSDGRGLREEGMEQLLQQGFTRGLASSLTRNTRAYPLRIWIVDNSGSMNRTDGHRFVETASTGDVRVVACSRWDEIRECVSYHAEMAAALDAPTSFRMLNDPGLAGVGAGSCQQFGVAEGGADEPGATAEELRRARDIMRRAQPGGVTPLAVHVEEIRQSVVEMTPRLRAEGRKVVVVLATDGLPTDDRGYGGQDVQQRFVEALRGLEGLPIWVVVRLCTDEEDVVEFYNDLDAQLELSLEVLDDFLEEAKEVHSKNPWLNYALPLHRLREMGYQNRTFDMIDERPLTHGELRDFACLIFGLEENDPMSLPDPSGDWDEFYYAVKTCLMKENRQWDPIKRRVDQWIDLKQMDKRYGDGHRCICM